MRKILHLLAGLVLFVNVAFTQVIEVNKAGSGDFGSIQEGIEASNDGDTVLVYPGIYFENINFNGKNITVASLYLTTGDENYIYQTIIDGNHQGSVVLIISGEDETTVLCGFTIQNGSGSNLYAFDNQGGGIGVKDSYLNIKHCIIKNNAVNDAGGGIFCKNSIVTLAGVTICDNYAHYLGGGVCLSFNSDVIFDTVELNNIYLNYSPRGGDFRKSFTCPTHEIIVDTFTVINPDHFYINSTDINGYQLNDITVSILHPKIETVNEDLYVSPDGHNANSGLTVEDPLQSISFALSKIISDSLHPNTIHIANGIYSPSATNEKFPLGCRSYISFEGESIENTILDGEYLAYHFWGNKLEKNISFKNITFKRGNGNQMESIGWMGSFWIDENININFEDISICECQGRYASAMTFGKTDNLTMKNVFLTNNEGASALRIFDSRNKVTELTFENLTIKNNHGSANPGDGNGGGIGLYCSLSHPHSFNCIFINSEIIGNNNTSPSSNPHAVGLSVIDGASALLVNSTIGDNTTTATNCGSVSIGTAAQIKIYNSIIYNPNLPWEIVMGTWEQGYVSTMSIHNSLLRGGDEYIYIGGDHEIIWGNGIIDTAPMWKGYGDYPYALQEESPCIDAGTPLFTIGLDTPYIQEEGGNYYLYTYEGDTIPLPSVDLAGNPRIVGSTIDMGAYEYQGNVEIAEYPSKNSLNNLMVYPNPFSQQTNITFSIDKPGEVVVEIYNTQGRLIKTLMDAQVCQGNYTMFWEGENLSGSKGAANEYICKLLFNKKLISTRKIIQIR